MKFNQYLLIFMAVAITCLHCSVISGEKKNPKKKIAIATEKDPGILHIQPLHGFKTRQKNEPNRSNTYFKKSHIIWIVLTKETVTSKLAKLVKNREKISCEKFQCFFYFTRSNIGLFPKNTCACF